MFTAIFGRYPDVEHLVLVVIPMGTDLPLNFTAVRVVAIAHTLSEAVMYAACS